MTIFAFGMAGCAQSAKRQATRLALIGAVLFSMAGHPGSTALGQGITGSIAGTVTDPSGAPVSRATVTVRETDTGIERTITTSDVGSYRVPDLSPGKYSVRVALTGFTSFEQDDITLAIDQVAEVDVKLALGSTQQTVEVSSSAPVIQTETSSVGLVVDSASLQNTPLNGHVSILGLINLVPGGAGCGRAGPGSCPRGDAGLWHQPAQRLRRCRLYL
jgi:hypothetical protein